MGWRVCVDKWNGEGVRMEWWGVGWRGLEHMKTTFYL